MIKERTLEIINGYQYDEKLSYAVNERNRMFQSINLSDIFIVPIGIVLLYIEARKEAHK